MNAVRQIAALSLIAACACGSTPRDDPLCAALTSLRGAIGAVGAADSAEKSGDVATVRRQIDQAARLISAARSSIARAGASAGYARQFLEAANYLEYIVSEYRAGRQVDATLTQFASRELTRRPPGEQPMSCQAGRVRPGIDPAGQPGAAGAPAIAQARRARWSCRAMTTIPTMFIPIPSRNSGVR